MVYQIMIFVINYAVINFVLMDLM